MDVNLAELAAQVVPYLGTAVAAYGGALTQRASDQAAEHTVDSAARFGHRIWSLLRARARSPEVIDALAQDLAADPGDEDVHAAARVQLRKAFAADEELVAEIVRLLEGHGSVAALGPGAVATNTNAGVISTGDNATIQR
jgi:hypothetical protein